jgi:hypothetical protein
MTSSRAVVVVSFVIVGLFLDSLYSYVLQMFVLQHPLLTKKANHAVTDFPLDP